MGWSHAEEKPKEFDASLYKDEGHWNSSYPNSLEQWIKDFKPHYELVGEYVVDESHSLYRFQRDESLKHELSPYSPRFYNVLITCTKKADDEDGQ